MSSLWDTAALMTLAASPNAVTQAQTHMSAPGWVDAIPAELRRLIAKPTPPALARVALTNSLTWLGPTQPLISAAEDAELVTLRDRIAGGAGHPDEHLGEAQSIIVAKRTKAIVVTDDGSAREEAAAEGVLSVSTVGMLALQCRAGKLTISAGDSMVQDFVQAGRLRYPLQLNFADLVRSGHIRM